MAETKKTQSQYKELFGFDEFFKLLENFNIPGVDVHALAESQRKDMEALAQVNREAYEGIKALANRRNEMLQEAFDQWQKNTKDATSGDFIQQQSEAAKQSIETAIANFRELAEMEAETRRNAWKIMEERFHENLDNLQKFLDRK